MPGTNCAVAECSNNGGKKHLNLSFHRFPRDHRRADWINRCKRLDNFNPNTSFICSAHFEDADYEVKATKSASGLSKRMLKPIAFPHLNLPSSTTQYRKKIENKDSSRHHRMTKRSAKMNESNNRENGPISTDNVIEANPNTVENSSNLSNADLEDLSLKQQNESSNLENGPISTDIAMEANPNTIENSSDLSNADLKDLYLKQQVEVDELKKKLESTEKLVSSLQDKLQEYSGINFEAVNKFLNYLK